MALVNDKACRIGLLHARSLDPGLLTEDYRDMLRHFEVDFRNVTYVADLRDGCTLRRTTLLRIRTWEEVGQWVDMATLRRFAIMS